jgi:hypothetical protein
MARMAHKLLQESQMPVAAGPGNCKRSGKSLGTWCKDRKEEVNDQRTSFGLEQLLESLQMRIENSQSHSDYQKAFQVA